MKKSVDQAPPVDTELTSSREPNGVEVDKALSVLSNLPAERPNESHELQASPSEQAKKDDKVNSTKNVKKNKKRKQSIDDFLRYAYERNGQRLSLTSKEASEISLALKAGDQLLDRFRTLVSEDVGLRVPRELLMSAEAVAESPRTRDVIFSFVRDVMLEHRLFRSTIVQQVLLEGGDSSAYYDAFSALKRDEAVAVEDNDLGVQISQKVDKDDLQKNARSLLATYIAFKNSLSVDEVISLLFDCSWVDELDSGKSRTELIRSVVEIDNPAVVAWVIARARDRINEARRSQLVATGQAGTATTRVEELTTRLQGVEHELKTATATAARLEAQLLQLEQDWLEKGRQESMRSAYKLQTLRGKIVQLLEGSVDLLQVGITAVARSPDNGQVLLERAESVVDALHKELSALKASDSNDIG